MSVTLHEGTTFLVTSEDGDVHRGSDLGLYFQDSRFLSRLELRLDGESPIPLSRSAPSSNRAWFVATNPELPAVAHKVLGIVRRRTMDDSLHEDMLIENYGDKAASFVLDLEFDADFAHIFDVKQAVETGTRMRTHATAVRQTLEQGPVSWVRLHRDGLAVETALGFSVTPEVTPGRARFRVTVPPHGRWELWVCVVVRSDNSAALPDDVCHPPDHPTRELRRRRREGRLGAVAPSLETDHEVLLRAWQQAAEDMVALRISGEDSIESGALAAGIPWYMALFGRDSLIASYQSMLHDPALARGTLRALARLQGTKVDIDSAEQPGRILHEQRHGPLTGDPSIIPTFPYYGSIDSTPLFLVTLSEYVRCTGDLAFARAMIDHIRRAVAWMEQYGDRDGDGLIEYHREGDKGLVNQGWKDSYDSNRFRDGRIASGPIALVEVQGYAWNALVRTAELYDHLGFDDDARALRARADHVKATTLERYWIEDRGYYAEALDGRKSQVDALTSNPGHLLWTGLVPDERAARIADVLLGENMFSGFGIRTMANGEGGYNPISYHNGSVWPHENSLIAEGLARYGLTSQAVRVVQGMLAALSHATDRRLPELFAGYARDRFQSPVAYPSANRPQAWSSGAVILLVRVLLGVRIDAMAQTIETRGLPLPGLSFLRLRRAPIGGSRVDLELRVHDGHASVDVRGLPDGWRHEDRGG